MLQRPVKTAINLRKKRRIFSHNRRALSILNVASKLGDSKNIKLVFRQPYLYLGQMIFYRVRKTERDSTIERDART